MNLNHFKEVDDLVKQNKNLSGFDLYYIGFFLFHTPDLSPKDVYSLVHRILELYQNETINIQEKVKSLVRVLSKKIDVDKIQELKLVIKDENENRAPLKDYFLQIFEILPQYDKLAAIEFFYMGNFHAKLPSYRISELLKQFNNIKEVMAGSLTDEEARMGFLLKILNNKLKEANNLLNSQNVASNGEVGRNVQQPQMIQEKITNENIIQKNSPKRGLKRDASSPSGGEYDHQLKKTKKEVPESRRKNDEQEDGDFGKFEFLNKNQGFKRMATEEEEELSRALIAKLEQDEKEERDKIKAKLEVQNFVNCAICLDDLYATKFKPLEKCSHVFHEECMKEYLQAKIDEKGFPIICPELECKNEITLTDVIEFMDDKYREKFESFSFKAYLEQNANEVSCCPTADCTFAFVKEEDQSQLKCPVCKKHYCLDCRVIWHKGMSCKEYQVSSNKDENDLKFEKFVKGKRFRQCPKCSFWVSKIEGCKAMVCRCKTQFCYNCGSEGDGHNCPCRGRKKHAQTVNNLFQNNNANNLFQSNPVSGNLFYNNNNNQVYPPNVFYNTLPLKRKKVAPKRRDQWLVGEEPSDADTLNSDDD